METERTASTRSELIGGTIDEVVDGEPQKFPWVVGVEHLGGGIGTGTVLSRRVVVASGHLASEMVQGCEPFTYTLGYGLVLEGPKGKVVFERLEKLELVPSPMSKLATVL